MKLYILKKNFSWLLSSFDETAFSQVSILRKLDPISVWLIVKWSFFFFLNAFSLAIPSYSQFSNECDILLFLSLFFLLLLLLFLLFFTCKIQREIKAKSVSLNASDRFKRRSPWQERLVSENSPLFRRRHIFHFYRSICRNSTSLNRFTHDLYENEKVDIEHLRHFSFLFLTNKIDIEIVYWVFYAREKKYLYLLFLIKYGKYFSWYL